MDISEKAVMYFKEGFNCSQSVFTAIVENAGLEKEAALRIATGFGGGIARMQKTCGAVTGAVMALGYLHGNDQPGNTEHKEEVYSLVNEFVHRFVRKHNTIECNELLGYSLVKDEDKDKIKELNLFETVCTNCVRDAILILEELKALNK